ncbi:hypothetical protein GCM10028793_03830 [Nocardiopsis oceani]
MRNNGTQKARCGMDPIEVEVEDLAEVTSRDITAGGDSDGTDSSSDFI